MFEHAATLSVQIMVIMFQLSLIKRIVFQQKAETCAESKWASWVLVYRIQKSIGLFQNHGNVTKTNFDTVKAAASMCHARPGNKKNPPFFHLFLYQWHLEALLRVFCCRMIIRKSVSLLKHIEAFNEPRRTVELTQSLSDSKGFHGEVIQRDESKIICIYPSVHSQQCKPCAGAAGLADTTKCCQWASLCWNLSIIDLEPVRITINTKNPSEWFVCLVFFVLLWYKCIITGSMEVAHSKEM